MTSISVRLTFQDEEFYQGFIEPRKVSNELPSLLIRLLTVYAKSDDLAYQIDQYIDRDSQPAAYEAREAMMQVIAQLNSMEASVNQELETISSDTDEDEDDFVETPAGGFGFEDISTDGVDTPYTARTDVMTPASVAEDFARMTNISVEEAVASQSGITMAEQTASTPQQAAGVPQQAAGETANSRVFTAIDSLTGQVSQLTTAITALLSGLSSGAVSIAPVSAPVQAVKSEVVNSEVPVEVKAEAPVAVEAPVEEPEDETDDVPDFMLDALESMM